MQFCSIAVQTEVEVGCDRCRQDEQQTVPHFWMLKINELTNHLTSAMQIINGMKGESTNKVQSQSLRQSEMVKVRSEEPLPKIPKRETQQPIISNHAKQQERIEQNKLPQLQNRILDQSQLKESSFTEIEHRNEESFLQNERTYIITLVNDIQDVQQQDQHVQSPHKYHFKVEQPLYNKFFNFDHQTVVKKPENRISPRGVIALQPISKTTLQEVSIRIRKSRSNHIYFGLVTAEQARETAIVHPKNSSAINYFARGGKSLYVLNKNEEQRMPAIEENSVLKFRVDYRLGRMQWYRNEAKIHTTENIDFQSKTWHPYVVLKDTGDSVELL